ncbi:MAG: ABC transporter permease [Tissierellales bacterium]|nr:ABC transporter permease [Tissierellales bacterium]MBN2828096.1 ABC transporter permease [Tissierellales bacterium]
MLNQLGLRFKLLKDDRIMIIVMTVMALALTFIFSSSMSGSYRPSIMVIDQDRTQESRAFIKELQKSRLLDYRQAEEDEAIKQIEQSMAIAGLVVRNGFGEIVHEGGEADLEIIRIKDSVELIQLEGNVRSTFFQFSSKYKTALATVEIIKEIRPDIDEQRVFKETQELSDEYWKNRNPFKLTSTVLSAEKDWAYNPLIHYLIGFTLFFSTFTIVFVGADILKEKQQNTWQRKLVSPVKNTTILLSLLITTFTVGMAQVGLIVIIGNYFLDIVWGMNIGLMLVVFAGFVYTFTAIGLVLGGLAKSFEQLSAFTPIILVASAMLGGTMWPLEIIQSKILLFLANLMPHKWALEIIEQTAAYGLNINNYIVTILVLFGMGTVYLLIGIYLHSARTVRQS